MTPDQMKLTEILREKFFCYLPQNNWENIEVNRYWTDMNDAGLKQNTDIQNVEKVCAVNYWINLQKLNEGS